MTTDTVPQTVLFPDLFDKPLFARFNQEQASSDGGAILLKAAERIYGLVKAFAGCLFDKRAPDKTRHSLADLIGQRIFGIACGHPDCNDGDRLADDPIHKLLLDRDPVSGERLASQPTLSRFENAVNGCALYRMADELATRVIARHRRRLDGRARCITIDLDPTDDPTHGAQQYTLFNGYYDNWCYLPLLGFLTFDRESEQYLCAALLRHGKAVASEGTVGLLSRLLPRLRRAFPRARILVRLDGGFASPAVFAFLEAQPRLDYVIAMAKNAVLERYAEPAMLVARARTWRSEQTEHVYTETNEYQAGTWNHARRVVIKAEVVRHRDREPRDNPRFVVTNMRQTPRFLYEKVYCARGDAENRIKEGAFPISRSSAVCRQRWTVRLGEVEPVFGQTGRVVLDITARTAHDGALKWTRPSTVPSREIDLGNIPVHLRTALRRVLEFEARAPAPRSAEEAEQLRRAAAGHRGRVLRRPPHPRAATRGALRRGWRRGERPRAPPAPADAERRPGDRQRSHLPGHDGAGHDAVLPRVTRPSGEAEAGTLPRLGGAGHLRPVHAEAGLGCKPRGRHAQLAGRIAGAAPLRRHRPGYQDPPLDRLSLRLRGHERPSRARRAVCWTA